MMYRELAASVLLNLMLLVIVVAAFSLPELGAWEWLGR